MHVFSYVVRFDDGNAPNPFGGFLTLAICKPRIRKYAREGDILIGTGSANTIGVDRLVYAAKIAAVVPLDVYGADRRFARKRPSKQKWWRRFGDNIYVKVGGMWRQRPNEHHGPQEMRRDLSGVNALVCRKFWYFGEEGPRIPREVRGIIKKMQGHIRERDPRVVERVLEWIESMPRGRHGSPYHASEARGCSPCVRKRC
jgi:hypothetical protein